MVEPVPDMREALKGLLSTALEARLKPRESPNHSLSVHPPLLRGGGPQESEKGAAGPMKVEQQNEAMGWFTTPETQAEELALLDKELAKLADRKEDR